MKSAIFFGLVVAASACARDVPMQPGADAPPAILASKTAPEYTMIDLGDLGGGIAYPMDLNDAGQVVGTSNEGGAQHAFLWENGTMRDLGGHSTAQRITEDGIVLGTAQVLGGPGGDECIRSSVVKWKNGVRTDVGPTSCDAAGAIGSTRDGGIVGWWDSGQWPKSSIWRDGTQRSLGALGRFGYTAARAINKHDQVVGSSTVDFVTSHPIDHPFIWESGVMRDLGVLFDFPCDDIPEKNCGNGKALDINKHGDAVGTSNDHAVLWTGSGIIDIAAGDWFNPSQASDINDKGEAVGSFGADAFSWSKGVFTHLPSLGGRSAAVAVNEKGIIAGFSTTAAGEQHVVVWHDEELVDLGVGFGTAAAVVAINGNGDVLGVSGPCVVRPEGGCYSVGSPRHAILWRRLLPQEVAQQ